MAPDELAAELLASVFEADPLSGSLYGFPGYDDLLPDFGAAAEAGYAATLASIAERAERSADAGLAETELQTLDFVRCMARAMADAAEVPTVEFTISDTFAAPVGSVFTMLPKLQLDTDERRSGYRNRLAQLPWMLETAARRHEEGTAAGRTAVARLVESAIAQLDLLIADPTVGGFARPDSADGEFGHELATIVEDAVRPALAAYRDTLRGDILPAARDDDHPGICFLPDGESMYRVLARLHTSTGYTPDDLHTMGRDIVDQVGEELQETGDRLWHTTDLTQIFERLSNDPAAPLREP